MAGRAQRDSIVDVRELREADEATGDEVRELCGFTVSTRIGMRCCVEGIGAYLCVFLPDNMADVCWEGTTMPTHLTVINILVMGHSSGQVIFIEFDLAKI